jgi:nucleoside-diphosphate-sugar epimerase
MNILVTGGLGFIGHNVVKQLQDQGHQVSIIDSQTNYGIIPQEELNCLLTERYTQINENTYVYNDDITDNQAIKRIFEIEQPEIVIHLASFPRQKVVNSNPSLGSRVMSEGLLNLLEASNFYEVRKFIYISSSMVYGDFNDDVKEDYECKPQGQYAILKLAGEWLVKDYFLRNNLSYTIIRPSSVYGLRDVEDRVVSKFFLNAMNGKPIQVNGKDERLDFTYIDDVATGIVQATVSDNTDNQIYNITRSESYTLYEAALMVKNIVGSGEIIVNDRDFNFPSRGKLNIDKARQDFDYYPTIDIKEGFQRYYNWLRGFSYYNK